MGKYKKNDNEVSVEYGPNIRFNLPKILEFIYEDESRDVDVELEEMKQPDMNGNLRVTQTYRKEFKHGSDNKGTAVRYSLIEMFVRELCSMPITVDPNSTSLGSFLIMNTMVKNDFIISDKTEEDE